MDEQAKELYEFSKEAEWDDYVAKYKALITDKLVDKLYELMDEAEEGHPDGCNSVHTHNIEAHIAELIKENK